MIVKERENILPNSGRTSLVTQISSYANVSAPIPHAQTQTSKRKPQSVCEYMSVHVCVYNC